MTFSNSRTMLSRCSTGTAVVAVVGGEDDEARGRELLADANDGGDTAKARELEVHEGDIGLQGAEEVDGFDAIAGLADDFDLRDGGEQSSESLTDYVVVLDDHDTDWF